MPPDRPSPKIVPHPWLHRTGSRSKAARHDAVHAAYAELQVTSNFTFLTGASNPEELVEQAAHLEHGAIALTDRNTLGGVVRAHVAARETGMPFVVGCRLDFLEETGADAVLVYPTDRAAYGRLCGLLTVGKRRAPKGECHLAPADLLDHQEGLLAVVVPPEDLDGFAERVRSLGAVFDDDRLSIATSCLYGTNDERRLQRLMEISGTTGVPLVATNDVHYHLPERRALQDVLTCVRHGCTLDEAGFRLFPHGERHLKPAHRMARLFRACPEALERTSEIAERASRFSLDELRYQYPEETRPPGTTPMEHLIALTWEGAEERYPDGIPAQVRRSLEHEFAVIAELNYAPYFLTVHDIVAFARSRGILCQGRGAAANSAVCYCLGVTAVDPDKVSLLFERFVSKERDEPPDIDVDFEHERREEVLQYVYEKYGRDRAALTAEVITYRGRSAVRDVGKALGLSLDLVDRLAKNVGWELESFQDDRLREIGVDPSNPMIGRLLSLCEDVIGFPRHRSQHVGGFVITRDRLCELVPIENCAMDDRTVIEWDKDDIDAMGMLKVDLLALGMLTCVRKAIQLVNGAPRAASENAGRLEERAKAFERHGLTLHTIPAEDPAVYDMICKADTVGVFQIESRAQMAMLPRLRPREFYDLVIEVAIVRPGPIHGGMVHPYLRRRAGEEAPEVHEPKVQKILGKTLGVPLFQEQAMALAVEAGGFTPGEADELRRSMAAWKRKGKEIERFGRKLIAGMQERGYPLEFAERCYKQIQGFSEYGFPESHAASFALLVYVSAWLKCYHPAAFAAALINSQPMGFYAPAQIVRDARDHGVEVRAVDVNHSDWDCTLEYDTLASGASGPALRLGMRLVRGLRENDARRVRSAVECFGRFDTPEALHRSCRVTVQGLRRLAYGDAFRSMSLDRQEALWRMRSIRDEELPLFERAYVQCVQERPNLPEVTRMKEVVHDYASAQLSLKAHPFSFLRHEVRQRHVTPAQAFADEQRWPHRTPGAVAGLVLSRQRPSTAKGIVFLTLEDETGVANVIVKPRVFERHWQITRRARIVIVRGHIERQGEVVHMIARELESLDTLMSEIASRSRDFH